MEKSGTRQRILIHILVMNPEWISAVDTGEEFLTVFPSNIRENYG